MTEDETVNRAAWTAPHVKKIAAGSAEDGDGLTADAAQLS
jgi:hypothetical protein